jgi:hypothetical protein
MLAVLLPEVQGHPAATIVDVAIGSPAQIRPSDDEESLMIALIVMN